MKYTLIFSTLVLSLSTVAATMTTSVTHRLREASDRLVLEQAIMGGTGGSTGGNTPSTDSGTGTSRLHQQPVEIFKAMMKKNFSPRELQATESLSFEEFCSTVSEFYQSAGYYCECDTAGIVSCGLYPSLVLLGYDATVQDYLYGIDCTCMEETCDPTLTTCVVIAISDSSCGVSDFASIAEGSNLCPDCTVCSTETGFFEIEADICYGSDVGCSMTMLITDVPKESNPIPSPTPPSTTTQPKPPTTQPKPPTTVPEMTFELFCSTVTERYESVGYTCECDNVKLVSSCLRQYEDGVNYSSLVFAYSTTTQDYKSGRQCYCTSSDCNTRSCVRVDVVALTCDTRQGEGDDSTICEDCRVCSTATGMFEINVDGCYSTNLGCIPTHLISVVPK